METHNEYLLDVVKLFLFSCVCSHTFLKFSPRCLLANYGIHCDSFPLVLLFPTGPFGEHDDEQVFVQRVIPEIDKIYVRLSATGCR